MSYFNFNPDLVGVRVVKYIRCSHEGQVLHGDTLEAQNLILDEFIATNKMVLVDTFIDEAMTARKKYTKRKEFVRLLDGVRSHNFDLIIFTKLDRWFRNIGDYHKIQEILDANHVQWKAVTENYDTTTTNGRLHINIRLSVAQDECDRDSDRIKDVFAYKLKNKTFISGALPRGLMLDAEKHVVHDPEWKQWALDMFDHFESCCSKRDTLLFLMDKYNMYLCYDTIVRSLKNPLYKGFYRDDPDFCEPLIDPARFDRIQNLAIRNVRVRRSRQTYVFCGLLVCASCEHYMTGVATYHTLSGGKEKMYKRYRCNMHASSHSCPHSKMYSEEMLEQYMISNVCSAFSCYIAEYAVAAASAKKRNTAAEIAKIERKLKKLYDLFMDDLIDKEAYKSEYDSFNKQLNELKSIPFAPANDYKKVQELLSGDWSAVYTSFNNNEKNAFWKSFIDKIVIHEDGKIDIIFL